MQQARIQNHGSKGGRSGTCGILGADGSPVDDTIARHCHALSSVLREPVLRRTFAQVAEEYTPVVPSSVGELGSLLDSALLDPAARPDQIVRLGHDAATWQFGSVSVNSRFVTLAAQTLAGTDVAICATVGFPFGAASTEAKIGEAQAAVWDGAGEIDVVLPIGLLKAHHYQEVFADILYVRQAMENSVRVRAVLEAGMLTPDELIDGAYIAVAAGADAVKTSTGFLAPGPSPADVHLLRRVLGGRIGIKVAGQIHTWPGADAFLAAGATRVTSRHSVDIVRGFIAMRRASLPGSIMDRSLPSTDEHRTRAHGPTDRLEG